MSVQLQALGNNSTLLLQHINMKNDPVKGFKLTTS